MAINSQGAFITVEGVEGVGKTTNIEFIKKFLLDRQIDFLATREPGGTPLAEELRHILLSPREESFDAQAELLLIFAARAQHLNTLIVPALNEGRWVLSDRFTDATYAYQGFGRGLSLDLIERLEDIVQQDKQPDFTLYLDLDVDVGLQRALQRGAADRFEQEHIDFFERVRQGYLSRVKQFPQRFCVIDASRSIEEVQEQIAEKLSQFIDRED